MNVQLDDDSSMGAILAFRWAVLTIVRIGGVFKIAKRICNDLSKEAQGMLFT